MKNEKNYVGFLIHKLWQILKYFSRALSWAQTSYFWRVSSGSWVRGILQLHGPNSTFKLRSYQPGIISLLCTCINEKWIWKKKKIFKITSISSCYLSKEDAMRRKRIRFDATSLSVSFCHYNLLRFILNILWWYYVYLLSASYSVLKMVKSVITNLYKFSQLHQRIKLLFCD